MQKTMARSWFFLVALFLLQGEHRLARRSSSHRRRRLKTKDDALMLCDSRHPLQMIDDAHLSYGLFASHVCSRV